MNEKTTLVSFNYLIRFILFIALAGCSIVATAQQTISGQVTDPENSPVIYATIQLKKDSVTLKLVQGAISGLGGDFVIHKIKSGNYLLEVSAMGYSAYHQKITVNEDQPLNLSKIILKINSKDLKEVIISSRKKLIVQKADRIIMNVDQSILAAGNDLFSILAMAPSLQVTNGQIRMQGKSNVLIILDGKQLPGTSLESVMSAIPGDQIDRIEIITNPSSKYDANASGGVIEIFTKRNKIAGWNASLGGNGSIGMRVGGGGNGSFNLSTKKIDFTTNVSYSQKTQIERGYQNRDLYRGAEKIGDFKQDVNFSDNKIRNKYINTGISYHIDDKNTIGAEFAATTSSYDGLGDVNSQISTIEQRLLTSSKNNIKYAADLFNYNLKYKTSFDSLGSNLIILGSYANYKNDKTQIFEQSQLDQNSNMTTVSKIRNFAPANFDIYTFSTDYTKVWSKEIQLDGGLKYTYTSNQSKQITDSFSNGIWNKNSDGASNMGYFEKVAAAYLNLNYVLNEKSSFQAGIRGENTNYGVLNNIHDSYFKLFPNLRFDYKWNSDFSSSFGYARNINRPAYEKLIPFELYIDNYTTQRGNPLLKPEYANSFFLNQIYKDYSLRIGYTITNDAISDLYLYEPGSLRFIATQENFSKSNLVSASFDIPLKLASYWNANIGINGFYKDLKFPSALNPAVVMKKSKYYYTLSTFNSFSLKNNWSAELNFYYYSNFFDGLYDIGGFSNLSAGIKKTFLKNKASLKFDVSDIFYDSNMMVKTTSLPTVSTSMIRRDTRRFRLTFKYNISGKNKVKSKILNNTGNDAELNRLGM